MRVVTGLILAASFCFAADRADTLKRLNDASAILSEAIDSDRGIPRDLLDRAHCAVIVPDLKKGAFIVGAQYGKGFMSCRRADGWSAPLPVKIEGGSVGFQIGASEGDLVLLVMNQRAVDKLLSSKFTLGAEGEVAAGPVGRKASAETDARMSAEILSWSRAKGVFAGISLKGATLRKDDDDITILYGKGLDGRAVIGSAKTPPEGQRLVSMLQQYSPQEKK
jgi:SH3 domain-containing YSC84-like protein 1